MGAQLVRGGSVSPLKENGVRRKTLILHASNWLQNWCWQKHFGFYDSGSLLEDQYLLGRGGSNSFGEVQVWLHGCSAALEGWMQGGEAGKPTSRSCPLCESTWNAWGCAWGEMRSQLRAYG